MFDRRCEILYHSAMRRLLLLLVLGVVAFGQPSNLVIYPLSDITGSGATVALSTSGTARFCQLNPLAANGAVVRLGDATTSISRGVALAAGSGMFIPPSPGVNSSAPVFQLNAVFVYIANGDKLSVTCWR